MDVEISYLSILIIIIDHYHYYYLKQDFSLNLELVISVGLTGQGATPEIHLSLFHIQCWVWCALYQPVFNVGDEDPTPGPHASFQAIYPLSHLPSLSLEFYCCFLFLSPFFPARSYVSLFSNTYLLSITYSSSVPEFCP